MDKIQTRVVAFHVTEPMHTLLERLCKTPTGELSMSETLNRVLHSATLVHHEQKSARLDFGDHASQPEWASLGEPSGSPETPTKTVPRRKKAATSADA